MTHKPNLENGTVGDPSHSGHQTLFLSSPSPSHCLSLVILLLSLFLFILTKEPGSSWISPLCSDSSVSHPVTGPSSLSLYGRLTPQRKRSSCLNACLTAHSLSSTCSVISVSLTAGSTLLALLGHTDFHLPNSPTPLQSPHTYLILSMTQRRSTTIKKAASRSWMWVKLWS